MVMKNNGVLIIENVQSYNWINRLIDATLEYLHKCIKIGMISDRIKIGMMILFL